MSTSHKYIFVLVLLNTYLILSIIADTNQSVSMVVILHMTGDSSTLNITEFTEVAAIVFGIPPKDIKILFRASQVYLIAND